MANHVPAATGHHQPRTPSYAALEVPSRLGTCRSQTAVSRDRSGRFRGTRRDHRISTERSKPTPVSAGCSARVPRAAASHRDVRDRQFGRPALHAPEATQSPTRLLDGRPRPIRRHVERVGKGLPPRWRAERLTPVIRHLHRLSVSKLCDGDVAIRPPIAVVRAPLDHHRVATGVSPADTEPQPDEVGLHLGDSLAPANRFTAWGHCRTASSASGTPSTCQASFVSSFRHRVDLRPSLTAYGTRPIATHIARCERSRPADAHYNVR